VLVVGIVQIVRIVTMRVCDRRGVGLRTLPFDSDGHAGVRVGNEECHQADAGNQPPPQSMHVQAPRAGDPNEFCTASTIPSSEKPGNDIRDLRCCAETNMIRRTDVK
jgi:hypothetical protein